MRCTVLTSNKNCKTFTEESAPLQMSNTKYQLPGSTNMYVDLVDDEDVKLMFDEWADYLEAEGKKARTAKLHIYIDYQSSSKRTTADTGVHHATQTKQLQQSACMHGLVSCYICQKHHVQCCVQNNDLHDSLVAHCKHVCTPNL